MKRLIQIATGLIVLVGVASCYKYEPLNYSVDKPQTVAEQEDIDAYPALKTYINRTAHPNFKLGAGVSLSEYLSRGVMYRLANRNFDEIVAGYEMKHGAVVQADGSLALEKVKTFLATAKSAGLSVYGHTLTWHANQNAVYLNSLIAPVIIPPTGGPTWDVVTSADFETSDASNYESNTNAKLSFTAAGEGANGTGRALKITNDAVRTNDWDAQFFIKLPQPVKAGEQYELKMNVRSDANASFGTQAHIVPYSYKFYDFFGTITSTPTWTTYTKQITIGTNTEGSGAIAFNLGKTATNYYFDNITVKKYNESGGGPSLDPSVITNTDFENGVAGWAGWGNGSTRGQSAAGEGYGGTGYSYKFTNPSATNFWSAQVAYDFPALENGSTYKLNFKVKASAPGTIRAEVQSSTDYSSDPFGTFAITTDWKDYTLEAKMTKTDRNRLVISFGDFAGTVYIDNITLRRVNPNGGAQIIEKTSAQKDSIITAALNKWITGMVGTCKSDVKAWDIVNEPMDDGKPAELKTGVGRTLKADEFYWQDYMGKDYAVKAIAMARAAGNPNDLLFINDYNLEYNLDKCKGLIAYVNYIESKGAKVDGIGTQMHISTSTDKNNIAEMFKLLAATGKLIKISELDLGVGVPTTQATVQNYQDQAAMYKYVIDKYFELIPANQRYGITIWSPMDSPANSGWRAGEPIGLWTEAYVRKLAYAAVAEALKNNAK
jgi:endo-1,4-beta-xylanase